MASAQEKNNIRWPPALVRTVYLTLYFVQMSGAFLALIAGQATPLRRGAVKALRARARPPVHSVDPYSCLVRVSAGGLFR